jgi:glutamine amidotransferase
MCRFAIYQGPPIPVSHLLVSPNHSLRKQSYACRERRTPDNEDGYGIGWYNQGPLPNLLHGELPAHQDPIFESAARNILSHCFFGHVRAASKGMHTSVINCHPFACRNLLWMHNGVISGYERIEPRLRERVNGVEYALRGNTDSEGSFALFVKMLQESAESGLEGLKHAMIRTLQQLEQWRGDLAIEDPHYLNFAVTDGTYTLATRYFQPGIFPLTLYMWRGDSGEIAKWTDADDVEAGPAVIVASEPVQDGSAGWEPVPINHLVACGPGLFEVIPLK